MNLHSLQPFPGSRKGKKRVGRGIGSGHGTYSTRGMKGQRARSGGRSGLKLKGIKQMLLRIPKVRGFKSIHAKARPVNIAALEEKFNAGDVITPATLAEKGCVRLLKGKTVVVKILGDGTLSKALKVEGCVVSKTAKEKIEKAGGSIK